MSVLTRKDKSDDNTQNRETKLSNALILLGLVFTLIIILIPLLAISKYSFAMADDYSYLYEAKGVWKETHSVIKTVVFEAKQSYQTWKTWQGLYFTDWLYLCVLAFFAEKAYFMGTVIGLASLIAGGFVFAWFVFHKIQGADVILSFIAILPVIMFQILIPTSGVEAFYWMASSVLYTFTFALSVSFGVLLIYGIFFKDRENDSRILKLILFFLAFAMGGSGYVTGVPVLCLMAAIVFVAFLERKDNRWFALILLVWFGICFAFNVFSPGAAARQNAAGEGDTAIHAILMSFSESLKYIRNSSTRPVILMYASLVPVFFFMTKKSNIKFSHPVFFTLFSYALFSSMFTPNLYALKIIGMYRVQNLYRFAMLLMIPLNLWYWIGFAGRIIYGKKFFRKVTENKKTAEFLKSRPFMVIKLVFAGAMVVLISFDTYKTYGRTATSISAFYSLKEGEAQNYYNEWQERLSVLEDESVKDPVFEAYTTKPYLLFFTDLSEDNTDWVNEAYARYFSKNTVSFIP